VSLKRDVAITLATRLISRLLALATGIILARELGPAGRGIVALALVLPYILQEFSNLGLDMSNTHLASKEPRLTPQVSANTLTAYILVSIVVYGILLLFLGYFKEWFFAEVPDKDLWLATPLLPLNLLLLNFNSINIAQGRIQAFNLVNLVQTGGAFLLITIFLPILGYGVTIAVLANVLACLAAMLVAGISFIRHNPLTLGFHPTVLGRQIRYAILNYIGNLLNFLNFRVDLLIVSHYLNATEVGFYTVASGLVRSLRIIPQSVQTILFPRVSAQTPEEATRTTILVFRQTGVIMLILGLGCALLAYPALWLLYGADYLPATGVTIILSISLIALFGNNEILFTDLAGRGKPIYDVWGSALILAINIPLSVYLTPRVGIVGAALATSVSALVSVVYTQWAFHRVAKISIWRDMLLKVSDFTSLFSAVLNFILRRQKSHSQG
jgi:O-antigen/teichoic acid export membrane protein